jgi:hypothetical protein
MQLVCSIFGQIMLLTSTDFTCVSEGYSNNVGFYGDGTGRKRSADFKVYMEGTIVAARKDSSASIAMDTSC